MNERIKKLAELSKTPKTMMVDGVLQSVVTIDAERFAELILKECTDVLMQRHEESKHSHNYYHVTANMLKNHFGVEE